MAGFGQVNSYLVGPAREGAGQNERAARFPTQYTEKGFGFLAFAFAYRRVFAADFSNFRIRCPRIIFRGALDPCEIFLFYAPLLESPAQGLIYPLFERKQHNAARFPVEPVVDSRVAVRGPLPCEMAQQGRENIVVGVVWGLLAWNTGFLVILRE